MNEVAERLIRRREVQEFCGIGTTTIYKLMNEGLFPRPVKVGGHAVRWRLSDVNAWIAEQQPAAA